MKQEPKWGQLMKILCYCPLNQLTSVAEPEPPEPYHFDPRRTGAGTVSLL